MTQLRDDVVGLDASIIMHPKIWEASGHTSTFSDLMVDCLLTKKRFRADQVEPQSGTAYFYTGATRRRGRQGIQGRLLGPDRDGQARRVRAQGRQAILSAARASRIPTLLGERTEEVKNTHPLQPGKRQPADRAPPVQPDAQDLRRPGRKRGQHFLSAPGNGAGHLRAVQERAGGFAAEECRLAFARSARRSATRSTRAISPSARASSSRWSWSSSSARTRRCRSICGHGRQPAGPSHPGEPQPNWGWQLWHQYWVEQRLRCYESIGLAATIAGRILAEDGRAGALRPGHRGHPVQVPLQQTG